MWVADAPEVWISLTAVTHADNIRGIIHKEYKINDVKAKAVDGLSTSIQIAPLGLDRTKGRIWSFDGGSTSSGDIADPPASGRIYRSGNPFKRPCPLETITHNRTEVLAYHEDLKSYTSQTPKKPEGSGPKGKLTPAEVVKHRKIVKGVEDEAALVGEIEKLLPEIEKEEAVRRCARCWLWLRLARAKSEEKDRCDDTSLSVG